MKILFVNDYTTPTGGAELGLVNLRHVLRERGHDARLFASRAGLRRAEAPHACGGQAGADRAACPPRPGTRWVGSHLAKCELGPVAATSPAPSGTTLADHDCFGTTSRWRTILQTANPWARAALRRVLREFRPDIVHVRMFLTQLSPAILSLLRDVPAVYDVVWYRSVCPTGLQWLPDGQPCRLPWGVACYRQGCLPLRDWLPLMAQMQWWLRQRDVFDAIIAKSQDVKRQLLAARIGPVEVIWDGVPVRPSRPPLSAPPLVAFAGRLVPEKGGDVLLRAFAQLRTTVPDARLLIVGDGPERTRLAALAAALNLTAHVTWTGHLPQAEMEQQLDRAWVQAVPSQWAEPFGLVAIEAMMRGTAVVATGTGGLGEIVVDGQTGAHVPPGDADALARALTPLLQGRDRAEQLGRAGRQRALAQFTKQIYVEKLLALYQRIRRAPEHGS